MSLGGSRNQAVNDAVRPPFPLFLLPFPALSFSSGPLALTSSKVAAGVSSGLFFGIAAGNSAADVVNFSPGSEPSACTVGATDDTDTIASFSNYGALVDIFAPGVNVLSTWNDGKTNTISGKPFPDPRVLKSCTRATKVV